MSSFTASLDETFDDFPRHHFHRNGNDHGLTNDDPTAQWRPQIVVRRRNTYDGLHDRLLTSEAGQAMEHGEHVDSPNDYKEGLFRPSIIQPRLTNYLTLNPAPSTPTTKAVAPSLEHPF
jgi:hypothetical protein